MSPGMPPTAESSTSPTHSALATARLKAAAIGSGGRSAPAPAPSPLPLPASGPGSDQFMTALATEHFTLATSRASTVAEAGARSTLFMGTVSSFVVALAFIGTVSEVGPVFELFALALLPVLFALGLLTYLRLSESALEDVFYAKAINRIRHYYLELDPSRAGYIALSANDDFAGVMASAGHRGSHWHTMSHTATMVLVVTGVIGGASIGLFSSLAFNASYGLATAIAGLTATTVVTLLLGLEERRWTSVEELPPLFPSPTETASSRSASSRSGEAATWWPLAGGATTRKGKKKARQAEGILSTPPPGLEALSADDLNALRRILKGVDSQVQGSTSSSQESNEGKAT